MREQMTVEDLLYECQAQIRAGNGRKKIVISSDDEGNSFHGLFWGFTYYDEDEYKDLIFDSTANSAEDTIILG